MAIICPASGHVLTEGVVSGPHCPMHGVPWFTSCSSCGALWPVMPAGAYTTQKTGAPFCANCGKPGQWLTRAELLAWIRNLLRASRELPDDERLELISAFERLDKLDPNDTHTVAAWRWLKRAAPKVWEASKPVLDPLMSEAVKRVLGL